MTEMLGEILRDDDTASVTFTRHHDTDATDLWEAVTAPERLARWFAPLEGDLHEGGEFVIRFDDKDTPRCRVVSCDAPRSYTWEWTHEDGSTLVRVDVAPEGDGSRLLLEHTRLPVATAAGYGAGWQAYVQALEAYLAGREGGDWWDDFHGSREAYAAALS